MFETFFNGLDTLSIQLSQVRLWLNRPVGGYARTVGSITGNPFMVIVGWIFDFTPLTMFFSSFMVFLSIVLVFRLIRLVNPLA